MTAAEDWRAVLATNLDGAFYCTKAVIRGMMRQRSGRIVYVSSDAALLGDLMRAAYSASKAGLLGLTKSVARELAPSGITVNAVAPGVIATDMTADTPETRRVKQLAAIPLSRFGEPAEVAAVIRFFLSPHAAYITGQVLSVDGGLCI
jgi:3-oxoacyl-[acyl-carrier protein] reductase